MSGRVEEEPAQAGADAGARRPGRRDGRRAGRSRIRAGGWPRVDRVRASPRGRRPARRSHRSSRTSVRLAAPDISFGGTRMTRSPALSSALQAPRRLRRLDGELALHVHAVGEGQQSLMSVFVGVDGQLSELAAGGGVNGDGGVGAHVRVDADHDHGWSSRFRVATRGPRADSTSSRPTRSGSY